MNTKHTILLALLALAPSSLALAQETTTTTTTTDTTPTTTAAAPTTTETTTTETTTTTTEDEVASDADAGDSSTAASPVSEPTVLLSIRGGVFIPQVFNRLDTSFTVGLGVGYVLPFLDHRVAIVVDAFYTRPERSQTLMDPRLASGSYTYNMTQNDISMFVGFLVHFTDLARDLIIPYAGLGARIHFLWSDLDGTSGGNPLGFHRETSTQGGGAIRVGCGIRVGPGMIALDVELGLAPLDHIVTGSANIGNLGVSAGYTVIL